MIANPSAIAGRPLELGHLLVGDRLAGESEGEEGDRKTVAPIEARARRARCAIGRQRQRPGRRRLELQKEKEPPRRRRAPGLLESRVTRVIASADRAPPEGEPEAERPG